MFAGSGRRVGVMKEIMTSPFGSHPAANPSLVPSTSPPEAPNTASRFPHRPRIIAHASAKRPRAGSDRGGRGTLFASGTPESRPADRSREENTELKVGLAKLLFLTRRRGGANRGLRCGVPRPGPSEIERTFGDQRRRSLRRFGRRRSLEDASGPMGGLGGGR